MTAFVSPAVAVVSAITALASLLLYLHATRRSDKDSAREEALALAETRGQVIAELRASLKSLEQREKRMRRESERTVHELQAALEEARTEAREQAYQAQRFYAIVFAEILGGLSSCLEETPPDVDAARIRLRELLATTVGRPNLTP